MRGTGDKSKTPSIDHYNPLYEDPEVKEKAKKETQPEPKKLSSIVSEKNKPSIRLKVKSLTPRGPRTRRDPEIVTLLRARREVPTPGLTKVDPRAPGTNLSTTTLHPESSGSEIAEFSKITPRPFPRPPHDFLGSRTKSISNEPIDESAESSENAPEAEPLEKQRTQPTERPQDTTAESIERTRNKPAPHLPGVKPSGSARAKTASAHRGNLGAVVPSREKQKWFMPGDSWKASSDDAGFQEREPEYIDLMPLVPEKTTGGLTKIKSPPLFEEKHDLQSPRSKISMTLRRPVIEKKEKSLDTAHSEEKGIEDPGKVSRIELVEVHRAFTADELAALLAAEKKMSRIEEFKTPARLEIAGRRSVLPSVRNTAIQVTNSIGFMIREMNEPGFASRAMRALNILYYAASGENVIDKNHPEIEVLAKYSELLSPSDKFAFLKHLYKEVEEHLDSKQKTGLQWIFDEVERLQDAHFDFQRIVLHLRGQLTVQARTETGH